MCTYSQFMLDRGEKKGLETGKYKTYYDLISDGTLTLKQAAEKCSLSPDEFQKKLIELKIIEGWCIDMYIGEVLKQVRRMQQDVFSAASAGLFYCIF